MVFSGSTTEQKPIFEFLRCSTHCAPPNSAIKFHPEGNRIATASGNGILKVWDIEGNKISNGYEKGNDLPNDQLNDVVWTADGIQLVSASDDKSIDLWDERQERCVGRFAGHLGPAYCCAVNPRIDSSLIASGSLDETVRFWDLRTLRCLRDIPAHADPVTAVDFSPDGKLLVSSGYDGSIMVWDAATFKRVTTCVSPGTQHISSVRFSPDGESILAANMNNTIHIWDFMAQTPVTVKTFKGHKNEHCCIRADFLAHDKAPQYVVSGSEDSSVYVWDWQSEQVVQKIRVTDSGTVLAMDTHSGTTQKLIAFSVLEEPEPNIRIFKHKL